MAQNSFGTLLSLTTFGESHGTAIGGVLDGLPSGIRPDMEFIRSQLKRRASGSSAYSSFRKEDDDVEILSGIFEGMTTGAPLAFAIRNKDARSGDYENLKDIYRPSHADFSYAQKYLHRDYRGGGRSSARETTSWVVAGSLVQPWLEDQGIFFTAFVSGIADIQMASDSDLFTREQIKASTLACPDAELSRQMETKLEEIRKEGDSAGGIITCHILGLPAGLGEPVFDKFHASLGKAMLSINAVKGFEIGEGFKAATMLGSEHNDAILSAETSGRLNTLTNHAGGVLGGITNGSTVTFRLAFKPVASISKDQQTINKEGKQKTIRVQGRHDVCVVPRAVPVVESLAALISADFLLRYRSYNNKQGQVSPSKPY